jgi:fibronectin type III domain protein
MYDSAPFPLRRRRIGRALSPVRLAVTAGTVAVTALALFAPAALAVTAQNPIGYLDAAILRPSDGVIQVAGWTADRDAPLEGLRVQIYDNGTYVYAVTADGYRPDVGAAVAGVGPFHGYTVRFAAKTGLHQVCARAVNLLGGVNTQLGCRSVQVNNDPVGALEKAVQQPGGMLLTGYALDLNVPISSVAVRSYLDGRYVTSQSAATPRADLKTKYPTAGLNHGFSIFTPAAVGTHQVCAYAMNLGVGTVNTNLGCRTVTMTSNPLGAFEAVTQVPGGFVATGYALDPDVTSSISVQMNVDGQYIATNVAGAARPDLLAKYPGYGQNHGFSVATPTPAGSHELCAYAMNVAAGTVNSKLGCRTVSRTSDPVGSAVGIARVGTSDAVAVSGWALDPDSSTSVKVQVTSDGVVKQVLTANLASTGSVTAWPRWGGSRGFSATVALDGYQHQVCLVAVNAGAGKDVSLGCKLLATTGSTSPAAPTGVTAWPGNTKATLNWTAARAVTSPVTSYEVTVSPGAQVVSFAGTAVTGVITGLTNGVQYSFAVRALNSFGTSSVAVTRATPTAIPPQLTPAPVSTSHYVRNLTGTATTDIALMRRMGAVDAGYNPSGHSYLVLLQIGGQDEYRKGALLSATSRFVSYGGVVTAMEAYLDGYASTQKPSAPMTLAIGTNNDVDVSSAAGTSWARNVVNPVAAYAASRYPGTVIAGANDIEPGFSATVAESRAWVSGYLAATTSKYVFNGSADGCSTSVPGTRCNNGWTMTDLQWVSGGAAPTRTLSLPQIYNYAMPLQWKNISLTGTVAGKPRIYFGGPLTEVTACDQAGTCDSITNVDAWNRLWGAISSTTATKQSEMPHGTDLRIN